MKSGKSLIVEVRRTLVVAEIMGAPGIFFSLEGS